jgi:ABC-2 type transport system permease protein
MPFKQLNLTKIFGNFRAVDNISFKVSQGEIFGLLGHNGAGKTTTMKILCMLSFLGLGISATSIAKEQEAAQFILGFLQFPMIFLSGVLFPVEQMPVPLQYVKFLPLTYATEAMRKVMILGAGINSVMLSLSILVVLVTITITIGVPLFDKTVRN